MNNFELFKLKAAGVDEFKYLKYFGLSKESR